MTCLLGLTAVFSKRQGKQEIKIGEKKKKERKREKCKQSRMRINKILGKTKGGNPCVVPREF